MFYFDGKISRYLLYTAVKPLQLTDNPSGNTLCLSVQDNHTPGSLNDNVPIRMEACDPQEYRQKWMCGGGKVRFCECVECHVFS